MTDLPPTLTGLQDALARGQCSPREALHAQRERLRRKERNLHCVVRELPDAPIAGAGGPLLGIGLGHKDIFDLADWRPGLGRDRGGAAPGTVPATAVARLAGRGASLLASLTMAEYACGATGENSFFPRCVNPLRPAAAVGGSSSGSAVAVASEMVYGSLGTDTAGSVRMPAATCGLVGLKTTHGLIPTKGAHPLAPSLDSVGILARSAADAVQLLEATAEPGLLRAVDAAPLRVKVWWPEGDLHPDVAAALEPLVKGGYVAQQVEDLPEFAAATQLAELVLHSEAASTHRAALLDGTASAAVQAVALSGLAIPDDWYTAALADRARRCRAFVDAHLREHQMLLLPALPEPVPDWQVVAVAGEGFEPRQLLALHRYMGFVNYLGLPALVLPVAADRQGMPISVQLIARPFHERLLLEFAHALERDRFGPEGITRTFLSKGLIH